MAATIGYPDLVRMIRAAAERIRASREQLSRLDSGIGDGDHGSAMVRAMDAAEQAVDQCGSPDADAMLQAVAWGVMGAAGGAPGPLLGAFFLGMASAAGEGLDAARVAAMLGAGLDGMQKQTKAQVGDKTMIDALAPAVVAARAAAEEGADVAAAVERAAEAAAKGAESTRDLTAKYGKARNMGQRTVGHVDAGATSVAHILRGFADAIAPAG